MAEPEAAVPGLEWVDLSVRKDFAKHTCTPTQALVELLANAIDANLAKGVAAPPSLLIRGEVLELSDQGSGLELKHFPLGPAGDAAPSRLGHFGIGLKDAVVALLRAGANVRMVSPHGDFRFSERVGGCKVETIHVGVAPPSAACIGTHITVAGLPRHVKHMDEAKAFFLVMTHPPLRPLFAMERTAFGTITVYASPGPAKNHNFLYVNGVSKKSSGPLRLLYDVAPTAAGDALCFDRDHNVTEQRRIMDAVAAAARASPATLAELRKVAPPHPSCEFNEGDLRELLFPRALPPPPAAPASAASASMRVGRSGAGMGAAALPASSLAQVEADVPVAQLIMLYDFENAHGALETLQARACAAVGWRLLMLVGKTKPVSALPVVPAHVEVVTAQTMSPEAADTLMCCHAAQHALKTPSAAFLVVCGTEGRYAELVAFLGPRAELLRFDAAHPERFDADISSATSRLEVV